MSSDQTLRSSWFANVPLWGAGHKPKASSISENKNASDSILLSYISYTKDHFKIVAICFLILNHKCYSNIELACKSEPSSQLCSRYN